MLELVEFVELAEKLVDAVGLVEAPIEVLGLVWAAPLVASADLVVLAQMELVKWPVSWPASRPKIPSEAFWAA